MLIFLLIIIAVLLFVLASKIAPEELNSVWGILLVFGVIYLLSQYWQVIIAIPFVAFYALQAFAETEFFSWIVYTFGGFMLAYAAYVGVQSVYKDLSSKEGRAGWVRSGKDLLKDIFTITWKVLLYSVLGTLGLVALMALLIFIFAR